MTRWRTALAAFSALCALAMVAGAGLAQTPETDDWFRHPAISPDGSTILFSAHGDLWRVSAEGGQAVPITVDDAWEGHPVWSRDGRHIAFASDRFGDLDVFVMTADGDELTRLTYYSADDRPSDFTPDGGEVLFSSARGDSAASSYFPTGALPELYAISIEGGRPRMVMTNPAEQARFSPDGTRIAYREEVAYEDEHRKRDTSSFAREIWIYTIADGSHTNVTNNEGGDHSPTWGSGGTLYTLSEVGGAPFNVQRLDLQSGAFTALTDHGPHAARELSASGEGTFVYSYDGDLYTVREGEPAQRLEITLAARPLREAPEPVSVSGQAGQFAVSPDGSEVAFIARGEVFVTSVEFPNTVRITDTPSQERTVSFSPDGRSLLYAAERDGAWAIYETSLTDEAEPRFSAATAFEERRIYATPGGEAFQPAYSPDGESIAFIENRDIIRVIDRDGSNARTLFTAEQNYSYADGDLSFSWSPDSRWVTADYIARGYYFYTEIGVAPADGSQPPRDISLNGYQDAAPQWHPGGEVIFWYTDRFGERTHGSWGSEGDIVAAFLTQRAWDEFNLTRQERALLEEAREAEADEEGAAGGLFASLRAAIDEDAPLEIDFEGVEHRTARLTIHSSDLADAVLAPDLSALYYLAAFEGGYDLWVHDLHEGETRRLAALDAPFASIELAGESEAIVGAGGRLLKVDLNSGSVEHIAVNGEMILRADAERAYMFDHVWRQTADKFYDPDFHGVDWPAMREAYEPKLAGVSNNRDFAVLVSEMLGQLNASHTGMRYLNPDREGDDDNTAALGVIFDLEAEGPELVIAEILDNGPFDRDGITVEPGAQILAIGPQALDGSVNPFSLLNRRAGDRIRFTLLNPGAESPEAVTVRTYSRGQENQALYQRWIERRRAIVEARSNGRLGYVHIRSMTDSGFRQIYAELFGRNFDKEAVVIDTRFNGGGWLHDDLLVLLSGEEYFQLRARGRLVRGAPEERWTKPSALVMNEGNYSNAHMFPFVYKLFDLGPLVGMPVPGTGTAVWWEVLISGDVLFGIPQLPALDQDGNPVENQELQPDILVDNPPADAAAGLDRPVEAAVDALLEALGE